MPLQRHKFIDRQANQSVSWNAPIGRELVELGYLLGPKNDLNRFRWEAQSF
jgi:hypothetical protein